MDIEKANETMQITQEEINSVKNYMGPFHTGINILADLDPRKMKELSGKGWLLPSTKEEVKDNIKNFVNVYSVMLKNTKKLDRDYFYRGTTKKEADGLKESFNSIISTTYSEDVAKRFTEYNNGAIECININGEIPFIDASDYLGEYRADEKEIILAPFTKIIEKKEIPKRYLESYTYYRIVVEKDDLPDIDSDTLDRKEEELAGNYENFINEAKEYNKIRERIDFLLEKVARTRDADEYNAAQNELEELWKQSKEKSESIEKYKNDMTNLLKGRCRQKEKEIDLAKETIKKENERIENTRKNNEAKEKLSKIEKQKLGIDSYTGEVKKTLNSSYRYLLDNEKFFYQMAGLLGISYQGIDYEDKRKIEEQLKKISKTLDTKKERIKNEKVSDSSNFEQVDREYLKYEIQQETNNRTNEKSMQLFDIVEEFKEESYKKIQTEMYTKVHETIKQARIQELQNKLYQVENERTGIFGKINGKEKLKQTKIRNLKLKLELASRRQINPEKAQKYTSISHMMRDMMVDINAFSKFELNGKYTQEMADIKKGISNCFPTPENRPYTNEYINWLIEGNRDNCLNDYFENIIDIRLREPNSLVKKEQRVSTRMQNQEYEKQNDAIIRALKNREVEQTGFEHVSRIRGNNRIGYNKEQAQKEYIKQLEEIYEDNREESMEYMSYKNKNEERGNFFYKPDNSDFER